MDAVVNYGLRYVEATRTAVHRTAPTVNLWGVKMSPDQFDDRYHPTPILLRAIKISDEAHQGVLVDGNYAPIILNAVRDVWNGVIAKPRTDDPADYTPVCDPAAVILIVGQAMYDIQQCTARAAQARAQAPVLYL